MRQDLDRLDRRLLNRVQANNLLTAEQLSEHVPLSPSAITRRLRRLRDKGLIARDMAVLSPAITERLLRAVVSVQCRHEPGSDSFDQFVDSLTAEPNVQTCFRLSGSIDLLIILAVRDMNEFNAFAGRVLGSNPTVVRYETTFIRAELKNAPIVHLDEDAPATSPPRAFGSAG